MTKIKFSEIAICTIFWYNGSRLKKNKKHTAIELDKNGKHLSWTYVGTNDICEVE